MEVIRKNNPGAYRQPRWHYAADAESSRTICGKDVAEVKGDRRGSWQRGRIERKSAEGMRDYEICTTCVRRSPHYEVLAMRYGWPALCIPARWSTWR